MNNTTSAACGSLGYVYLVMRVLAPNAADFITGSALYVIRPNPDSTLLQRTYWICIRRYSIFVLALLLTATVFVVGGLRAGAVRIEPPTQSPPSAIPEYSVKRIPVARIILGPQGFAPAEIARPKGPFILAIHNRAKIDDLNLSLAKVAGNKLREMNFRKKKLDWRSVITLPPGDYVLSVAERPTWVCSIKIK